MLGSAKGPLGAIRSSGAPTTPSPSPVEKGMPKVKEEHNPEEIRAILASSKDLDDAVEKIIAFLSQGEAVEQEEEDMEMEEGYEEGAEAGAEAEAEMESEEPMMKKPTPTSM